ncbi:uncharacterized protein VTP21DRAFT_367 [Calcarisporiella thermophila]|uniref:uncharacterized protein n=1 Tax=Calcarisporiella thermophila TaxID=911321 RepID=UPI0037443978
MTGAISSMADDSVRLNSREGLVTPHPSSELHESELAPSSPKIIEDKFITRPLLSEERLKQLLAKALIDGDDEETPERELAPSQQAHELNNPGGWRKSLVHEVEEESEEYDSEENENTFQNQHKNNSKDDKKKPTKPKPLTKRELLEMHKESDRLIRNAVVALEPRVVKKKTLSEFLAKVKPNSSSEMSLEPAQCTETNNDQNNENSLNSLDNIASINDTFQYTSPNNSRNQRRARLLELAAQTQRNEEESDDDLEIVGGPPKEALAADSCLDSSARKDFDLSKTPLTLNELNMRLKERIARDLVERAQKLEEEAKAKGMWKSSEDYAKEQMEKEQAAEREKEWEERRKRNQQGGNDDDDEDDSEYFEEEEGLDEEEVALGIVKLGDGVDVSEDEESQENESESVNGGSGHEEAPFSDEDLEENEEEENGFEKKIKSSVIPSLPPTKEWVWSNENTQEQNDSESATPTDLRLVNALEPFHDASNDISGNDPDDSNQESDSNHNDEESIDDEARRERMLAYKNMLRVQQFKAQKSSKLKSDFVEEEAEESEDEFMGIGGEDENEDNLDEFEEDGVVIPAALEGLDKDERVDETKLRAFHMKSLAEQDKEEVSALLKDITNHTLLKRRRDIDDKGFGFDDDDWYDEYYHTSRSLPSWYKKKKRNEDDEQDQLAKLAANPETAAFAKAAAMHQMRTNLEILDRESVEESLESEEDFDQSDDNPEEREGDEESEVDADPYDSPLRPSDSLLSPESSNVNTEEYAGEIYTQDEDQEYNITEIPRDALDSLADTRIGMADEDILNMIEETNRSGPKIPRLSRVASPPPLGGMFFKSTQ